ncbi:MAG: hypothetical protein WCG87_11375 [Bacteroidota bacterium]
MNKLEMAARPHTPYLFSVGQPSAYYQFINRAKLKSPAPKSGAGLLYFLL